MSVKRLSGSHQDGLTAMTIDVLANIMECEVLGIVARDDQGVFIIPGPAVGKGLFEYLGTVDWKRAKLEASEHWVDPS